MIVRVFPSKNANILAFNISKPYFIYFNIPLYNTPNIKVSIFLTPHLNILYLIFIYLFLPISLSLSLSLTLLQSRSREAIKHQMVQTQLHFLNPTNPHNHHHHGTMTGILKKKISHPTQKLKLPLAATPETPNPPI